MKKLLLLMFLLIFLSIIGLGLYAFLPRSYTYDATRTKEYVTQHAQSRSQGLCALAVRKALAAGGCCMWGHPMCAKEYDEFLLHLDFTKMDKDKYLPQVGDIVVFNATTGHPYGHIAIWNGQQWVSDFRQRSFYVANAYRTAKDFNYFRMTKEHPKRHFTLAHHLTGIGYQPLTDFYNKIKKYIPHLYPPKHYEENYHLQFTHPPYSFYRRTSISTKS